MKILALDPATVTGWSFYDGETVSEVGHKTFSAEVSDGDRLNQVYAWTKEMLQLWKPDLLITEAFFISGRFANGAEVNYEIRGVIKLAALQLGVKQIVYAPTEWKSKVCGRTTPTKAEKKLYGKTKAKKMVTVNRLKAEPYNIKFPDKVKSETGRLVNFKFDCSDALGILLAYFDVPPKISPDLFLQENE